MTTEVELTDFERTIRLQELQAFVERSMANRILREQYVLPVISRLQLLLGAVVMTKNGLALAVRDRILAAMMMIFHGLSLHEQVTEGYTREERRRQLTVLGGDYLSSLFYKLLADTGHIEIIQVFARTITHINEAKTSLHKALFDDTYNDTHYLSDVKTIHGALIQSLCDIFSPGEQTTAFVDAAVMASVYDHELTKESGINSKSLANAILGKLMTSEERRQFISLTQPNAVAEKRFLALHIKYGTINYVIQGFREAILRLKELSLELFGYDGWAAVEKLFHPLAPVAREETPYVERG